MTNEDNKINVGDDGVIDLGDISIPYTKEIWFTGAEDNIRPIIASLISDYKEDTDWDNKNQLNANHVDLTVDNWYAEKVKAGKIKYNLTGCLCTSEERKVCPCKTRSVKFIIPVGNKENIIKRIWNKLLRTIATMRDI